MMQGLEPKAELLWASVREVLNLIQANDCGCDIVTVPHDILNKAFIVPEVLELSLKPIPVPGRISVWAKEVPPHVVIDPVHLPAVTAEVGNHFTPDEAA